MPKKKKKNAAPVSTSLEECYSEGEVKCSSVCDTSQEDSGIQDGEKSGECTELTSTSIVLDVTGEPSTDEGNETLAESSMPEGVELDTGEEAMGEEEKPVGPPSFLDVVPSYDSDYSGVLTDVEFSMLTGKKINDARPKQSCFNCQGDHGISQCTLPLNQSRISVNRKKRMASRMSVRYHEDCENKYGQYQPGKISESLRYALGLRKNQLPLYIYRMRVLGYPPGWLKEAEVHQADVKMYDAIGRTVSHPDEEEGEAEPTTVKYKPEKLVCFPGFNDRIPRGLKDESQKYNLPPMQPCHQMSEFLRFMNQNKAEAYKKKKLKDSELRSKTPPLSIEMEVEECEGKAEDIVFNPPLPDEDPPPPPPPDTEDSASTKRVLDIEDGEITEDSQESMESLTVKKQKILKELEKESTQSDAKGDTDNNDGDRETQDSEDSQPSLTSGTDPSQSENSCSGDSKKAKKTKTKRHHRSHSMGFKLGTMIPDSSTPYKTLPSPDKWTVDVSDHIVFDNLPDALGTWDKMKGVMGAVRKKMTVLHADEDD
ncbi:zinc finger CCHC domain-containing protein 8 homolog isoform X1 [Portunus trituberculatus]|uniref:zinc finger CCHC domain-containing protein 8 homolog isoform X1 n=1 Tax=Portunus trituberculatus TaxID=210409 RepID=UPI001E1CF0F6|nr:zinc finger CCHC domain-containing protein 8 homolog isoform X1 [Portunus trituberculatus]